VIRLLPWVLGLGSLACFSVALVLNLREHLRAPWVDLSGPGRDRLNGTISQLWQVIPPYRALVLRVSDVSDQEVDQW
jgi:hypothetical protein